MDKKDSKRKIRIGGRTPAKYKLNLVERLDRIITERGKMGPAVYRAAVVLMLLEGKKIKGPYIITELYNYLKALGMIFVSKRQVRTDVNLLVRAGFLPGVKKFWGCGKPVSCPMKSSEIACEKVQSNRGPNLITEEPKKDLRDKYNSNIAPGGLSGIQPLEVSVGLPGPGPGDSGLGDSVIRDSEVSGLGGSVIRDSAGAGARQSGVAALSLNEKQDEFYPDIGLFNEVFWRDYDAYLEFNDTEYLNPKALIDFGRLKGINLTEEILIKMAQKWFGRLFADLMKAENLQGRSDRTTILGDAEREGMFQKAYNWAGPEGLFKALALAQQAKRKTRDSNPLKTPIGFFVKRLNNMIGEPIRGP